MYCTKCGKFIEYNALVCNECKAEETPVDEVVNEEATVSEAGEANNEFNESADEHISFENVKAPTEEQAKAAYQAPYAYQENPYKQQSNPYQQENPYNYYAPKNNGYAQPEAPKTSRKLGLGKAIAACILAFVSYIFFIEGAVFVMLDEEMAVGGFVVILLAIAPAVIGLIFGLKSIDIAKKAKAAGNPMPIPTLVLGIVALSFAALVLFCLSIVFFVAISFI